MPSVRRCYLIFLEKKVKEFESSVIDKLEALFPAREVN
jgi:hypothetical protein